jgi:malate synthase
VLSNEKAPWFIDLLNINLDNDNLSVAKERINLYMERFTKEGIRLTENLDFK